ncbi:translocation/assembly module TamB domain-containing protein [Flavivirga aquatica]|nr:translocation/assembly module TamB domain-containing protein [Flavivirga aquatica]
MIKFWKVVKRIIFGLFLLFIALILFIRSPWGQDIIVNKATAYISGKTKTKVAIEKLYITFSGNIFLKGFYLEDKKRDTLLYSKNLEASIELLPLVRGTEININFLELSGLHASVSRKTTKENYNFSFLFDAFTPKDTLSIETETSATTFHIGKINFNDIKIAYNDEVYGINSRLELGDFSLKVNTLDFEKMRFDLKDLKISNTKINYDQALSFPKDTTDSKNVLPIVSIENFRMEHINVDYQSQPDNFKLKTNVGNFSLALPIADLKHQKVEINTIGLTNSKVDVSYNASKKDVGVETTSQTTFDWPEWEIEVRNIDFKNNAIIATAKNSASTKGVFNPEDININNLHFKASEITYKETKGIGKIATLSFKEHSGFELKKIVFNALVNDHTTQLSNLGIATNTNDASGSIILNYNTLNNLINAPEEIKVTTSLKNLRINPKDAFFFAPQLKTNQYIGIISQKDLTGDIHLVGTLNDLKLSKSNLKWGQNTTLLVNGNFKNITQTENFNLNISQLNFKSQRTDLLKFIQEDALGITLPKTIKLTGNLFGTLNNLKGKAQLVTSEGTINVNGNYRNTSNIAFNGKINVLNLELGKLLNNEMIGTLAFTSDIKGSGSSLNTLNSTFSTNFKTLEFNNYNFSNLSLKGDLINGKSSVLLLFKDENLDLAMNTQILMDTIAPQFNTLIDVKGANLKSLGITTGDIRTKFKINADFKGNANDFTAQSIITDAIAVKDNKTIPLTDVTIEATVNSSDTNISVKSNVIEGTLVANTDPTTLINALKARLETAVSPNRTKTYSTSAKMSLDAKIKQAPIIKDVFLSDLESFKTIDLAIDFNEDKQSLIAKLKAPHIVYKGSEIDSLNFNLNSDKEALDFNLNLEKLTADIIAIKKVTIAGGTKDEKLVIDLQAFDALDKLMQIQSEIKKTNDTLIYHIIPSNLVLNKEAWDIPSTNKIAMAPNSIDFSDFILTQGHRKIEISNTMPGRTNEHIGFSFKNFNLNTITSIFNSENPVAEGILNGDVVLENPFEDMGVIANASITDFLVMQVPLGKLNLNAKSKNESSYTLDFDINGERIALEMTGDYMPSNIESQLDFDIKLSKLGLKLIEGFTKDQISNTKGNMFANIKLTGTVEEPRLYGNIGFNDATLKVNTLNTVFLLPKESIKLENNGIYFKQFTLLDENKNSLVLDGKINTKKYTNPVFELSLKAKNIQVLKSVKQDNSLFYGDVNLDTDITIAGDLRLPKIDGSLKINKTSNFTYVIPESELDIVEKEGVVVFVNKKNPDDILTKQTEEASVISKLKGFDIDTRLVIDKDAVFNIVVDEQASDNLKVSGTGDFQLGIEPNGSTLFAGKYEVKYGHYEVSLYNLVKRKFTIAPGSSIVWQGDFLDADMNIKAIYEVKTAASGLMATKTTRESKTTVGKYRQKIPFLVYLNLKGEILKPEISFNLDIPKDNRGEFGGEVYSQVQQLNTQEEDLNKQVFSLLVFNQFFPSVTSDGSSGGSLSIARDNVNNVLSNQLNNFSSKILGDTGLELDFGLDSYTDYKGDASENKTQIDINARKKLFNDKLIVEVGSGLDIQENSQNLGETTPLIGTVSIQYLLSEDDKWRIKGYRKNEFESVIDGQVIITGIALIFNQEFNKFKELFERKLKEEVTKDDTQIEIKDKQ